MRIAVALACWLASAATAFAHAELDRAEPRVGATVASAPAVLTVDFSEPLHADGAALEARDEAGRLVSGPLRRDAAHPARVTAPLRKLRPGRYTVRWRAVTGDDEETQGRFFFTVAP